VNGKRVGFGGFYFLLLLSFVLMQGLLSTGTASGADLYVNGSWGGPYNGTAAEPYKTIQDAVNASASDDNIFVAPGIYPEEVVLDNKNVNLSRWGDSGWPTIDGGGVRRGVRFLNGDYSAIDGFRIQNCVAPGDSWPDSCGGGVFAQDSYPMLTNCELLDNSASQGGGIYSEIYITGSADLTLTGCTFDGNTASQVGGAVFTGGVTPRITGCLFDRNSAGDGFFGDGGAFYVSGSPPSGNITKNVITRNSCDGYGAGGYISWCPGTEDERFRIEGNAFANNWGTGALWLDESKVLVGQNTFVGNSESPPNGSSGVMATGNSRMTPTGSSRMMDNGIHGVLGVFAEVSCAVHLINNLFYDNHPSGFYCVPGATLLVGGNAIFGPDTLPDCAVNLGGNVDTGEVKLDEHYKPDFSDFVCNLSTTEKYLLYGAPGPTDGPSGDPFGESWNVGCEPCRLDRIHADLDIQKMGPLAGYAFNVTVEQKVEYYIRLENKGPGRATEVVIKDKLPSNVQYVSHKASYVGSDKPVEVPYDQAKGEFRIDSLDAGQTLFITVVGILVSGSIGDTVVNEAEVSAKELDPNEDNDKDSATITVRGTANLEVTKTVDNPTPARGQQVVYTITITNNGPDTATEVVLTEKLPSCLSIVSIKPNLPELQGSLDPGTTRYGFPGPGLANGQTITVKITCEVSAGANVDDICTNIVSAYSNEYDPVDAGKGVEKKITVRATADMVITKYAVPKNVTVEQYVTYDIFVRNDGPDKATGVVIKDILPPNVSYVSHEVRGGVATYDQAQGKFSIGSLDAEASPDPFDPLDFDEDNYPILIVVKGKLMSGSIGDIVVNVAEVSANEFDPNEVNNVASGKIMVRGTANLEITKDADNSTPARGQQVIYTITIKNNGPDTATGIILDEKLPPGMSLVSIEPDLVFAPPFYKIPGELAVGKIIEIKYTCKVDQGAPVDGILINKVFVSSNEQNLNGDDSGTIETILVSGNANLNVKDKASKLARGGSAPGGSAPGVQSMASVSGQTVNNNGADPLAVNEGNTVVYTTQVTNHGPHPANVVEIVNQMFPGVTYVSSSPAGDYNATDKTVKWNIDRLANGESVTLTVTVTVNQGTGGTIVDNIASVTAATDDPDLSNNTASAPIKLMDFMLLSAHYEVMIKTLTLVFNGRINPALTRFGRIAFEVANSGTANFGLSPGQPICPVAVPGTPYLENGVMLYPVSMNILCEYPSWASLCIFAFMSNLADDIDVLLGAGAFTRPQGGESPPADVPLVITAGGFALRTKGDVSGDGKVTAYDAALVLRCTTQGRRALPIYDVATEISGWLATFGNGAGDPDLIKRLANTDGLPGITANDAAMILQFSAGFLRAFCRDCGPIAKMTRRNGKLVASSYRDQILEVSIDLDDATDVHAADIAVTYDPQALTVIDVSGTEATSEWLSEYGTTTPGKLRISLAGASPPAVDGSLVTLRFHAASADAIRKLDLTEFKLNGGRLETTIQNLPKAFALLQNYPNPFNPETWIPYYLSEPADVTVTIYSVNGQVIRQLKLGTKMPGSYVEKSKAAYWDGKNRRGEKVSSGIYFYQLQANQDASVKKMIIAE